MHVPCLSLIRRGLLPSLGTARLCPLHVHCSPATSNIMGRARELSGDSGARARDLGVGSHEYTYTCIYIYIYI